MNTLSRHGPSSKTYLCLSHPEYQAQVPCYVRRCIPPLLIAVTEPVDVGV